MPLGIAVFVALSLWRVGFGFAVFTGIWDKLPTDRVVGALWPNDPDGNAWGDAKVGFPSVAAAKKLKLEYIR